ncbi:U6 snRNA-associated Sm-like protein LSm5, partial [Triplophysa rosa]
LRLLVLLLLESTTKKNGLFYHCDVVAIQQNLIQFRDPSSLWSDFTVTYGHSKLAGKPVESEQSSDDLLIILHDDVNPRTDAAEKGSLSRPPP